MTASLVRLPALLSALLLLALPTSANAQYFGRNKVQYDQFEFEKFRTDRFEIYFYDEEREAVFDAARMAERWYERHSQTFLREFDGRKPLIFYANDADFQQTNAISGTIGQGTGGVTESLKERVIMPLTGLYSETDHVLGHELVHSFQYDIGLSKEDTVQFSFGLLPLWMIEGTAEYLSVGRNDAHTAMWLRDAALRDDLPTIDDLSNGYKYFPYRYGQAYMAYIGGKYGDAAVANLFKVGGRVGLDSAFVYALGIKPDSLSKEWIQAVKDAYLPLAEGRTPADSAGRPVVSDRTSGSMNIAPALSPDGKWVAFLSEKDLFQVNLFIADTETGEIVKSLKGTRSNPHFDAIRFISSAGSWAPDGRKFAFITFVDGDNELSILDWTSGRITRRIAVDGVTAMTNPSWSPDGSSIAFSGMNGGISDIYVFDVASGDVRQLTDDRFGDLQPTWSPDSKTIAFASDRGRYGTNFETLDYAPLRLSFVDVETGTLKTIVPFDDAIHVNPQYSPDGRSVFFISDQDGFKDVYRYDLTADLVYRVTNVQTGISGITSMSPALSVAAQSGRMAYSVFRNNEYTIFSLEADETDGTIVEVQDREFASEARTLPPKYARDAGLVASYLDDPGRGLPDPTDYEVDDYSARLKLDYVAPPTLGVSVGGPFGSGVAGGIGLFFSDMLGNHNLTVVGQANGTVKDIGAQVAYLNQKNRLNWGASAGHIPYLILSTRASLIGNTYEVEQLRQRIYIDQIGALASYPFSTTRRLELSGGLVRYGFDYEIERYTQDLFNFRRDVIDVPAPDPIFFASSSLAYIGDFSFFGFTSPIQGGRYRIEVSPFVGTESFVRLVGDYRRYHFMKPFTFAVRGLHVGNYFAKEDSPGQTGIFTQEYLGYGNSISFVRGYSYYSLDPEECVLNGITSSCAVNHLIGTRVAVASVELRLPLFGNEQLGLINFPYLPTELSLFADAGIAWTASEPPVFEFQRTPTDRSPVTSVGVSSRFNLFGYMVMEVFYVYPFQRPVKGAHFGIQLVPGW
jgi:Tol biopolymer transport system component